MRRETMLDNHTTTPNSGTESPNTIKRMFSVKKTIHREDALKLKSGDQEKQPSKFSRYNSIKQLERSDSEIPTELSFDEQYLKRKVYDFKPLTNYKLGSMFSRGTSPSNANSNYVSTTAATAPFQAAPETQNQSSKASEMNRLFLSRVSIADGKSFKPRTVMAVPSTPTNENNFLGIIVKKKETLDYPGSVTSSPSNQKDMYNGFLSKLTFTSLLEGGEKILKEISKSVIRNGKTSTVCCITWENGSTYEGEITNMKFHGFGVLAHSSGYSIKGEFREGKVYGKAEYTKGKHYYSGQWKDNLPHGQGVERVEGVFDYAGSFVEGIKFGKGKMKIVGKGSYEGEFKLNSFYGFGCFTWNEGKKYIGNWVLNLMHGKGKMTWPDGRKFEGRYSRNKKDGQGQFTWADGRAFAGIWKEGKQQGNGKYINLGGEKGQANWECGKLQIPPDSISGLDK